jgi:predicted DsbA family dithiol-disulfide isomerase
MKKEVAQTDARASLTRSRTLQVASVLSALVMGALLTGCSEGSATPKPSPVQQGTALSDSGALLATIGDERITMADVHARAADPLDQLETQYQLAKARIVGSSLDTLLQERLLTAEAKKTGKSVDELIAAETGPNGMTPSDAEIAAWYQQNPTRTGGRALDPIRPQIADFLRTERRKAAAQKLENRLRSERKVMVSYRPFRLQFHNDKAPALGKSDAPVTLVEFSDFQCPYCQAAAPTLKQVAEKFGDKVQIIYRQFPLPSLHPFALKAAEASLCANEQEKFWQMHDVMFQDQKKLAVSDLKQTARRLGLDGKKFDSCLDAGRYVEQVQNDQKEGQRVGVTGTPAIFINGTYVEGGSVPFSTLEALIEKELERGKPTT